VAVKVCSQKDLPPGDVRVVCVEDKEIAVYNIGGRLHAMENTCPHQGGPLSDGRVEGNIVTCPWHAWQFDVTTGGLVMSPVTRLATYPVEIRGEDVVLLMKPPSSPPPPGP